MTVTDRLKTTRHDIYTDLVTRTAKDEQDVDELENEHEYPFDTNYELFAAGLALGFLRDAEPENPDADFREGYIQVNRIGGGGGNEYRQAIEYMYELVKQAHPELDEDEGEVWEQALRYADAGVEFIYDDMDLKDDFDFLYFMDEAESQWESRLEDVVDYPQEETA